MRTSFSYIYTYIHTCLLTYTFTYILSHIHTFTHTELACATRAARPPREHRSCTDCRSHVSNAQEVPPGTVGFLSPRALVAVPFPLAYRYGVKQPSLVVFFLILEHGFCVHTSVGTAGIFLSSGMGTAVTYWVVSLLSRRSPVGLCSLASERVDDECSSLLSLAYREQCVLSFGVRTSDHGYSHCRDTSSSCDRGVC